MPLLAKLPHVHRVSVRWAMVLDASGCHMRQRRSTGGRPGFCHRLRVRCVTAGGCQQLRQSAASTAPHRSTPTTWWRSPPGHLAAATARPTTSSSCSHMRSSTFRFAILTRRYYCLRGSRQSFTHSTSWEPSADGHASAPTARGSKRSPECCLWIRSSTSASILSWARPSYAPS